MRRHCALLQQHGHHSELRRPPRRYSRGGRSALRSSGDGCSRDPVHISDDSSQRSGMSKSKQTLAVAPKYAIGGTMERHSREDENERHDGNGVALGGIQEDMNDRITMIGAASRAGTTGAP